MANEVPADSDSQNSYDSPTSRKAPDQSSEVEQQLKHVEIMVFDADHQSKSSPDKILRYRPLSLSLSQKLVFLWVNDALDDAFECSSEPLGFWEWSTCGDGK
ncbi:hypothetical protein QJS10_CPA02g00965 [Acorus calamus]|uniref:Uncharacterized protein n=1 Tax=Acorus calamus TaxID=4465 RepID=A0AAV9FBT2_ACOCL|nr:hypothetical protein QJS10_CPA02g00965 [Acorus calamus]